MSEAERSRHDRKMAEHLPIPITGMPVSDADIAAMRSAFKRRFDEDLPRTETLMAVAAIGYRMALRDLQK